MEIILLLAVFAVVALFTMNLLPAGGGADGLPGMTTRLDQAARVFLMNNAHVAEFGVVIHEDTVDDDNDTETTLRPGLVLVRVEAVVAGVTGKYVSIGHANAPAAGDIASAVILSQYVNMLDASAQVEDKQARGVIHGIVDEDQVIFNTDDAPTIAAIKAVLPLVDFRVKP